ncbi:uncharacterized protein L201_000752 [Kwoniella dendrophila CBS 6074]|uniref:GTPase-activating protein GYP5 n=1 Tax=Kwoniella dendrophila CBS 6074 TaxID=1295534 RepID=A0AAX4JKH4_9TREE
MSSPSPSPHNTPSSSSSSRLNDPTSPQTHAAEESELDYRSSVTDDVKTPSASSFNITTSPALSPSSKSQNDNETTPAKSKSIPIIKNSNSNKVKAAAAMFENRSSSPSSSSFRSIPVTSRNSPSPTKKVLSPSSPSLSPNPNNYAHAHRSPSPSPTSSPLTKDKNVFGRSPNSKSDSPFLNRDRALSASSSSPINTPSPSTLNIEKFQDISLSNETPQSHSQLQTDDITITPTCLPKQTSIDSTPNPLKSHDIPTNLHEPVATPPAKEPPGGKTSFFGSALNFTFPSSATSGVQPDSSTPSSAAVSQQPSRSGSTSSQGGSGSASGGWKSTMTNFLTSSRTTLITGSPLPSSSSSKPEITDVQGTPSRPTMLERNPSEGTNNASFLLQRVDSSTAARDRRISAELGGGKAIREGFERVRGEMESAAREMRRERQSKLNLNLQVRSPIIDSISENGTEDGNGEVEEEQVETVDWNFWGSVVQDFEIVAREKPKDLSKAIQMGIPPVIRGAIWQLMSSSKSIQLEETYKALLKIPSSHEKSIKKDLNRTFPNHKYFQDNAGIGQEGLFMVVKAYSLYDPEVGYTQGLAFIVAALLLNMPDEEAFCVLVRLMDSYNLRSHYTAEMRGLQLRLFQFDRLVEEILPLLHTHLVRQGVKSSIYAAQWFMTLFSYRFPLSLVYRVLDIVFAEGIEAIFRFSLALLKKSEDKLLELEFEQILNFLQSDLFEVYRVTGSPTSTENTDSEPDPHREEEWKANEFVRDAYEIRITPFMLDSYASEWEEQQKNQNKHALEIDTLRNANRNLSTQVKQLEGSLATMNQEHVELVRQLVMSKIEKEETENELVRYKMLYAELAHAQEDAMSVHSRLSGGSIQSHSMSKRPSS